MLAEVVPGPDGLLRDELRSGIMEPDPIEMDAWAELPPGGAVISEVGGRPLTPESGRRYYRQNWTEPSLELHGVAGGDAEQVRTIVPAEAHARLSMRLAPGQSAQRMRDVLEELLTAAAPEGADVTLAFSGLADPAYFDPNSPALKLAAEAIERACGVKPALIRSGGTIGVLAAWARKNIPVIVSGFALADDAFHAPNESYRLKSLELGERTAAELYRSLATL
jgi:acetylornithine deacetylase/succinyl-diaminopimelate desuccinylase-like protein